MIDVRSDNEYVRKKLEDEAVKQVLNKVIRFGIGANAAKDKLALFGNILLGNLDMGELEKKIQSAAEQVKKSRSV